MIHKQAPSKKLREAAHQGHHRITVHPACYVTITTVKPHWFALRQTLFSKANDIMLMITSSTVRQTRALLRLGKYNQSFPPEGRHQQLSP